MAKVNKTRWEMRRLEWYAKLATILGVVLLVVLPKDLNAQAPPTPQAPPTSSEPDEAVLDVKDDDADESKEVSDYVSVPVAVMCAGAGAAVALGITVVNLCNPCAAFYAAKAERELKLQKQMMERAEAQRAESTKIFRRDGKV